MGISYERVRLTKRVCDDASNGAAKQKIYFDSDHKGFGLLVGKSTKTFFVQGKVLGGKVERCKIDRYGVLTVEQARKRAVEMLAAMGRGESQVAKRKAKPVRGLTLGDAWKLHKQEMAKDKTSPKTTERYAGIIKLYLADWLARPLADITRKDVRDRHQQIRHDIAAGKYAAVLKHPGLYGKRKGAKVTPHNRTGESTANDAIRLLRAIWNTALAEDDKGLLPANPARDFRGFKIENQEIKDRVGHLLLHLKEWHAGVMAATPTTRRDVLLFALYTGMRKEAATAVRWVDVDFDRRTLRVPHPKGGTARAFSMPLSDYLVKLLAARRDENALYWPKCEWVFPTGDGKGHLVEVRAEVGVPFTAHDLRRAFASVATTVKVNPYQLKLLLNHSLGKGDVTAGYLVISVEDLREPMQQITDRLSAMVGDDEPSTSASNVLPMRKRM